MSKRKNKEVTVTKADRKDHVAALDIWMQQCASVIHWCTWHRPDVEGLLHRLAVILGKGAAEIPKNYLDKLKLEVVWLAELMERLELLLDEDEKLFFDPQEYALGAYCYAEALHMTIGGRDGE